MKRRKWEPDIIMAAVLEGLRGVRTVGEICREYQCSETQYYKWRDKFLDGGKRALHGDLGGRSRHEAEVERLQRIIGKQAIQIDILKKTEEILGTK